MKEEKEEEEEEGGEEEPRGEGGGGGKANFAASPARSSDKQRSRRTDTDRCRETGRQTDSHTVSLIEGRDCTERMYV